MTDQPAPDRCEADATDHRWCRTHSSEWYRDIDPDRCYKARTAQPAPDRTLAEVLHACNVGCRTDLSTGCGPGSWDRPHDKDAARLAAAGIGFLPQPAPDRTLAEVLATRYGWRDEDAEMEAEALRAAGVRVVTYAEDNAEVGAGSEVRP